MEITCKTNEKLQLHQLTDFQGGLKAREETDFDKIERSIQKHGFSFPFFVWAHDGINHVLDGHGRLGALNRMAERGETIPPLPVVYVDCKDEADAKEKLLKLNSTYGAMSKDSVLEFIGDIDIDLEDLALPAGLLELEAISPDEFGTDFNLRDGDQTFEEMTFQFSIEQAEIVRNTLKDIKDYADTYGNPNSNGNKLFKVVKEWAEQKK